MANFDALLTTTTKTADPSIRSRDKYETIPTKNWKGQRGRTTPSFYMPIPTYSNRAAADVTFWRSTEQIKQEGMSVPRTTTATHTFIHNDDDVVMSLYVISIYTPNNSQLVVGG